MMILSQDGMAAVNSDNVAMFEVKESETLPHETRLCATILITNGARFSRSIGTFRSPDRTELAKLALDYISFSISTGHKCSVQVPTEDEMRNILYIIDEASGVDDKVFEPVLGALSTPGARLLMCGNPTQLSGFFYDSHHKNRGSYTTFHVDGRNSSRVSDDFVKTIIQMYGEDSDVFRVRVAGEFPRQENDVFIPLPLVEKSIMTEWTEPTKPARIDIGCDVARYGDDRTVIGYKVDEKAMFYKRKSGQDLMQTADDIMELGLKLMEKYRFDKAIPIKIDDSGLGGGVTDRLRRVKREQPERFWWMDIIPVYFGQRIHHDFYYDSTTYMMSVVKNLLAPQTPEGAQKPVQLILPNDNDLVGQLSTRKYSMTDDAKIRVESKDAMKKRGMHSPDEADCILLLCLPVKPKRRGDVKK